MKKFITAMLIAALSGASFSVVSQERMIRIHKTDGTSTVMSVAELQKISFLAPGVTDKGITLNITNSTPVAVLFSAEPAIAFDGECLRLSSIGWDKPVEVLFDNVTDITLGTVASVATVSDTGIQCRISPGQVIFSGIPQGISAQVFTSGGKAEGIYQTTSGELLLSRSQLPAGLHIVRIGSFSAKIIL